MVSNPESIVDRLRAFQRDVRSLLIDARKRKDLHAVSRSSAADTIYSIDAVVDPVLKEFCSEWGRQTPLVLIAEGLEDDNGKEVERLTFPLGTPEDRAEIRLIV